jgi:ubiquinone/menaquinone biosynthesis C-methylase UbiE
LQRHKKTALPEDVKSTERRARETASGPSPGGRATARSAAMATAFDLGNPTSSPAIPALEHLLRGVYATHLLGVAAKLGLADRLRDGPRSSDALARDVGAHAGALHRVLRGLVLYRILDEVEPGRFALAPRGELLRSDLPQSMRDAALMVHEIVPRALTALEGTVKTGVPAFRLAFGCELFEHLATDPELGARFARIMARQTELVARLALEAYDFSQVRKLVDVGGGRGQFLAAVLQANPTMQGVLFELPSVLAQAGNRMTEQGLDARCSLLPGDFFETVPSGGDLYLLSWILHDWEDAKALRILTNCRRALGPGGRLLILEHLSPANALDDPLAILMDLDMLLNVSGRERSLNEYRVLLESAGLALTRELPLAAPHGGKLRTLLEAVPV